RSSGISSPIPFIDVANPTLARDRSHLRAVHESLEAKGVLKLQLGFADDDSLYLRDLILNLHQNHHHGLPITHSAERGWFWDVRPSKTFQSNNHQARSETMHRFDWHTDCSYEENPPQYFALQVIQPDRSGGGTLSVLNADRLLGLLSPFARNCLSSPNYQIHVPPEFIKNPEESSIIGSLLAAKSSSQTGSKLRFREDITVPLTGDASRALDELKSTLFSEEAQEQVLHLTSETLHRGSIIMMDNRRWLHARNEIRDPNRHLRRVRWNATRLKKWNSSWPAGALDSISPHPVLVTGRHQQLLSELSQALDLALQDIIDRWFTDEQARFPQRMPLEPEEEELLRWINGNQHLYRSFGERKGSWRPDFLVEQDETGAENFRICEINARFCWNGFMFVALGQKALSTFDVEQREMVHATNADAVLNGLLGLFDTNLPLHLVKGVEHGIDIHMFIEFAKERLGLELRLIDPNDLRLVPDPAGLNGYKLCCLAQTEGVDSFLNESGELVEDVHQLCLELHQREFRILEPEMQRQVSLRCFNDIRTILLAHDKRMLGIIREELESLTSRGVISIDQARRLDQGITPTILPGSTKLAAFLKSCQVSGTLKDDYILKPIRGGKGSGILFGDELSNSDWLATLELMRSTKTNQKDATYVVQRKICQRYYDVFLGPEATPGRCHMVGTFHVIGGEFMGLGIWRCGPDRLCAISTGAYWMVSVMRQP
ncbi:hypothetical protein N7462_006981, partial [Penicillium macrosclerotiorum]|uniref:uncharacterized protein n=1 Tax=Penicillium macrosclerotiorum TaxID=303699 RepID=UPI002548DB61